MLYNIYDYTIGMIEELEKHETRADGKQAQNSGILSHVIPVNHKKPIHEVSHYYFVTLAIHFEFCKDVQTQTF